MQVEQISHIDKELQGYEADLFSASTEYRDLARDAAEKRAAYDVAYAQEYLKVQTAAKEAKLTVPATEAMVVNNVSDFLTACRIAEAIADGSKRHLTTLQAIMSSVQTRAKLFQTEWALTSRQI